MPISNLIARKITNDLLLGEQTLKNMILTFLIWNLYFNISKLWKLVWVRVRADHILLWYGISYIHLKSCWLKQESLELDPFSTFGLIVPNSISERNLTKIQTFLFWIHLYPNTSFNYQMGPT